MPYTKGTWLDRIKAYPNRYILEEIDTGVHTDVNLYANEGDGVDGTPFNKSVMDDLENRIGNMFPVKIEDGGTGAANVSDAQTNLNVYSKDDIDGLFPLPIDKGGTGSTTLSDIQSNLDVYSKTEIDNLFPVAIDKGGTGATTAENARMNLGVYSSTEVDTTFSKVDLSNVTNENFKSKADAAGVGSGGSSGGGSGGVGKDLSGQEVEISSGTKVTASIYSEIFNDYRDRNFPNGSYVYDPIGNVASGEYSHAEGMGTTASGSSSHAEGTRTISSSYNTHAEGSETTASGSASHAEGYHTTASGSNSHAEGQSTKASGDFSHAEGNNTEATGRFSHAGGYSTTSKNFQFVFGKYNVISNGPSSFTDTSGDMFIIGAGTSSSSRKNALRTSTTGKTYGLQSFQGSGADYAEYFEWEDGNPYNEDRRGLFVTVNGEKVRKANFGDFIIGVISSTPTVVGDTASEIWNKMYLKDVFGDYITEEAYTEEEQDEQGNIIPSVKYTKWILNPEYDSNLKYENRESRNEWACVGLVGKLVVIDDGTCEVNGFCTSTYGGKATSSENGYRVLKRIDSSHIKILLK